MLLIFTRPFALPSWRLVQARTRHDGGAGVLPRGRVGDPHGKCRAVQGVRGGLDWVAAQPQTSAGLPLFRRSPAACCRPNDDWCETYACVLEPDIDW
jgi:hypothetical protein